MSNTFTHLGFVMHEWLSAQTLDVHRPISLSRHSLRYRRYEPVRSDTCRRHRRPIGQGIYRSSSPEREGMHEVSYGSRPPLQVSADAQPWHMHSLTNDSSQLP